MKRKKKLDKRAVTSCELATRITADKSLLILLKAATPLVSNPRKESFTKDKKNALDL